MRIAFLIACAAAALFGLLAGCATTGLPPSMGCLDPLAPECDDPSAYPPLTAQLPPWPFPRLFQAIPEVR